MVAKARELALPKNFDQLLKTSDLATLQAVFEICDVDARGGYAKQTALAFDDCPDDLARWLVSKGADLGGVDHRRNTPLHTRARGWRGNIAVLLELGAYVNAAGSIGTPLHAAADAKHAEHARQLLAGGARVDARDGVVLPLALIDAESRCGNLSAPRNGTGVRLWPRDTIHPRGRAGAYLLRGLRQPRPADPHQYSAAEGPVQSLRGKAFASILDAAKSQPRWELELQWRIRHWPCRTSRHRIRHLQAQGRPRQGRS